MTYSLAVTGVKSHHMPFTKTVILSDTQARPGGMAAAMQAGTTFLCQNPDGSQSLYRLDAERSTPANPVLLVVGP
jgi:hypothetical protein